MARLLIKSYGGTATSYHLNEGRVSSGRLPENTVILEDDSVSGRHAEIFVTDGRYTLRDLQSSNGTSVNGVPAAEAVIKNGDMISFGSVESRFEDQPQAQ